ncbi:cytochrome c oxidase assembly protein (plasmid) [Rhodococcus pseudokoreensis]|uniref:Cytochrome c oxidase assembly protein n=1 Tax=Rhodococcus pseudokoreensis TaxID=2811421 RepID=A0A974ZRG3_9NOCA|nr:cytochrome c oxidase assembly protein [Rhodococcus pseudokoreensis]QSE87641.1 cytochrome c oxidase assembly protein [Rhodococcus pseudokoreensis]
MVIAMEWVDLPEAPPSFGAMLSWNPQPLPILPMLGLALAAWYCWGVRRVRAGGRVWPWSRTASFLGGCLLLILVTGLGIEGYGFELFSVWMFQHLTLSMAVPPLLVLGCPGILLLRSTPHSGWGKPVLRAALGSLRSRSARILLNPGVTIPLFLFSYYGIYLSPVFDLVASSWAGHTALELVFLATGVLFIVPVLSSGPLPVKQSYLGRCFDLFVEMPLHVFIGVILMMATSPLLSTFTDPPAAWGVDLMGDQQLAGGLAWSYGEPVALIVVVIFAMRWNRDEGRANAVADKRTTREGDGELDSYNEFLKSLPRH